MIHLTTQSIRGVNDSPFVCLLTVVLLSGGAIGCGRAAVEEAGRESVELPQTSSDITAEDLAAHTRALSAADAWPDWYPDNQFKAAREAVSQSAAAP
jgi:hypothetical protein